MDGGFSDDFPYELLKSKIPDTPNILSIYITEVSDLVEVINPLSFTYRLISYSPQILSLKQIENMSTEEKENLLILKINVPNPTNFNLSKSIRMDYFIDGYNQANQYFNL